MEMKVQPPVIPSAARNLLLIFFSQKQIPRRYASRNDRACWMTFDGAQRGICFFYSTRNNRCLATLGMTGAFFASPAKLTSPPKNLVDRPASLCLDLLRV